MNIDASSSAVGVLLSDGDFGIFGNTGTSDGGAGGTTPAATSPVNITLSGYVNVTSKDLNLTLTDSTTSTTQGLQLSADGSYSFPTELADGDSYSITFGTYTGGQTCTIATGSGTAGTTGAATITCERQLAIAAAWKTSSGVPVLKLFGVNHSSSPYSVTKNLSLTVGGSPSAVDPDLVWNGTKYLLVWKSSDSVIKGQFYDIELSASGSSFTVYTGTSVTIDKVSAAFGSSEFAIVWSEFATAANAIKYQRINSSTGATVGSVTNVRPATTSLNFYSADVIWNGSNYTTAFRQKTTSGTNSLLAYSFTTGTGTLIGNYSTANGTDSLVLDYPALFWDGSISWLFYSQTNTNGSGDVTSATLMRAKNLATPASTVRTETNPYGCDPENNSGDQYMLPFVAKANATTLLVSYDSFCADMGVYNEVSDFPVTISSGAPGGFTDYSTSEIGSNRTSGSSVTCRTSNSTCFISAGDEYSDAIFLFDPDFTGGIGGTSTIYPTDSNGIENPKTVIQ